MSDDWLASSSADPKKRVDWFVRNYWEAIRSDAYRLIENWQDAEDIAQDTFIRVMKVLEDTPDLEVKAPRSWLRSFLRYAFLDFLRRKNKSRKYDFSEVSLEQQLETISQSEWKKLLEELVGDVSESTESNEGVAEIKREIVKLRKERMQRILFLHLFEELTNQEIANELKQPLGTVKSDIHDGKKLLRAALEERMQDER